MIARTFAPAKVNLFLHVGPPGADGYHPLSSLMVFADVGDHLSLDPAGPLDLEVTGPFAGAAPADDSNLVLKAAYAHGGTGGFRLDKQLPSGAGLGGGSADAAAAIRLLATDPGSVRAIEAAASTGSDVPACLASRPVVARGRGERLMPGPVLPPLPAVLIHPGAPCGTREIYTAYDRDLSGASDAAPEMPAEFRTVEDLAAFLNRTRNDLQAPAVAINPAVADVLTALEDSDEALFVRMTGSGSACFALCATAEAAKRLRDGVAGRHPGWWVVDCTLGAGDVAVRVSDS